MKFQRRFIWSLPLILLLIANSGWGRVNGQQTSTVKAVAADLLLRQVLEKNLLSGDGEIFRAYVRVALEGAGESGIETRIRPVTCERSTGSDDCNVEIEVVEPGASGRSLRSVLSLSLKVYQGSVSLLSSAFLPQ